MTKGRYSALNKKSRGMVGRAAMGCSGIFGVLVDAKRDKRESRNRRFMCIKNIGISEWKKYCVIGVGLRQAFHSSDPTS